MIYWIASAAGFEQIGQWLDHASTIVHVGERLIEAAHLVVIVDSALDGAFVTVAEMPQLLDLEPTLGLESGTGEHHRCFVECPAVRPVMIATLALDDGDAQIESKARELVEPLRCCIAQINNWHVADHILTLICDEHAQSKQTSNRTHVLHLEDCHEASDELSSHVCQLVQDVLLVDTVVLSNDLVERVVIHHLIEITQGEQVSTDPALEPEFVEARDIYFRA